MSITARFEFKPADCWIGLFWKCSRPSTFWQAGRPFELWICLVPMLPLHITVQHLTKLQGDR